MENKIQQIYGRIENGKLKLERPDLWKKQIEELEGKKISFTITKVSEQRTLQQNASLYLLFELLADELNLVGLTQSKVLSKAIDVEWNRFTVLELIWRPLQIALLKKKSTTRLKKTEDIDLIYSHLVRFFADNFGFKIPDFPSYENQY